MDRSICAFCGGRGTHIDEDWRYYLLNEKDEVLCVREGDVPKYRERIASELRKAVKATLSQFVHFFVVEGIAYLKNLTPVCKECHEAKHFGRSQKLGRGKEALNQLAKVNNVDEQYVRQIINGIMDIWSQLSVVTEWRIVIGDIGLDEELKRKAEELLNIILKKQLKYEKL